VDFGRASDVREQLSGCGLIPSTLASHARIFRVDSQTLRESVTGAIRYWEPRRLIYNAVLAAIVLIYFGIYYPASKSFLSIDSVLFLFLLVVLANVAYCAAYPVDIFVSASSYRDEWQKRRWVVFVIGLLFAAIITRFFALGMFHSESTGIH
jgi:hypothetical protein